MQVTSLEIGTACRFGMVEIAVQHGSSSISHI